MTFFEDMESDLLEDIEFEEGRILSDNDVERLLEEIEKNPDIKNAKVPEELREDVFKSIREYEAYKAGCERFLEFLHISDEELKK